jgi:hypothetical protein
MEKKKILLTHPKISDILDVVIKKCSVPIIGSTNFYEVLAIARAKEIEKLGIIYDTKGINPLEIIKRIRMADPTVQILAWDCHTYFEDLADYPELLAEDIFFLDSHKFKSDCFFEIVNDFFTGKLTPFTVNELTT